MTNDCPAYELDGAWHCPKCERDFDAPHFAPCMLAELERDDRKRDLADFVLLGSAALIVGAVALTFWI